MRIIYSKYFPTLQKQLYAMVAKALQKGTQLLVLVPAQASSMVERGIIQNCGISGFIDIEVLSFEKLTERVGDLAGGRTAQVLDGAGFSMLAKLAMGHCKERLTLLDPQDPALHMRVAELVSSLKNEKISPAQLQMLAQSAEGGMQKKLQDIACIYETMQSLAGDALQDGRDMEAAAAAHYGEVELITQKHVVLFGFDVLTTLRMQSICRLDGAAKSLTILAEAEQDGVLSKQWDNILRLQQIAQQMGREVQLLPIISNGRKDEIGHLFENIYSYPYTLWEQTPQNISLYSLKDRRSEVQLAAAKILEYTCGGTYRMEQIGVLVGGVEAYAAEIQEVFGKAEIPFFLQSKRSLGKSSLWAWMQPLLEMLSRKQWRMRDVYAYLKSGFVCKREEADALVRWCQEHGVKGWQMARSLGKQAPEALEALRTAIFTPVTQLYKQLGTQPITQLLLAHCEALEIEAQMEARAEKAQAHGLEAQGRFLRQAWPALKELLEDAAILGQLPMDEYRDALSAGVAAKEISIIPPTTDEVLIGDGIHTIWAGKKILFVLGMNEGMLPAVPDTSGLVTSAEAQKLREQLPVFPDKLAFEDQKAYLRKNLTLTHCLHLTYNMQDGQPSYLADRVCRLFPMLTVQQIDQVTLLHKKAALGDLARELRAYKEQGKIPGEAAAAYFSEQQDTLGDMLSEVYAKREPAPMPPATARVLYGAPRATVSRLEEYYRCPYKHFITYGMQPRETEEYGESYADVGTYVHELMEEFTRTAEAQGRAWETLDGNSIDAIMAQVAQKLQQNHNYGIFTEKRYTFMEKRLREEATYAVKAVKAQLEGTNARIAAGEAGFGGDILQLPTRYGMLTVRGRIDRVDEAVGEKGEYVRVVDYKTGGNKFSLTDVCCGVGLQLVVYLMAAVNRYRALGRDAQPAGGFYFNIALPYLKDGEEEEKRLAKFRMNGFLLAEEDAAHALDKGDGKLISMNAALKDLEISGQQALGENCFSPQELQQIFAYARHLLVEAAEHIYGGQLEIRPLNKAGQLACQYCEYNAVCMYDPQADAAGGRVYSMDKYEAFAHMQKRMQGGEEKAHE